VTLPLYLFDPDQTHDLLWAERINGNIATLLSNAFENHGPFDAFSLPVVLVDRYIPGGDSIPWASEWTTTYYEFLKPLSRTHLLTDGEINGSAYGFTPEYQANLPQSLNLGAGWPEKVKVKVAKGQTGSISWLERSHSECHARQYCPQVSNPIQVWTRRHKVLTAFVEDLELELDCRLWLHNSVVVQNASLEGITEAQKRLFRYADLDDVLEDCWGQFNISEGGVLTALDVTLITEYQHSYSSFFSSFSQNTSFSPQLFYSSPLFQVVPSQYYFAALLYAVPPKRDNKPLFTSEAQRTNLGKPVVLVGSVTENPEADPLSFYISLTYVNLVGLWAENAISLPWGLDLYQASPTHVLAIPLPNKYPGHFNDCELNTFTGNHNPSELMPRSFPRVGTTEYKTLAELPSKFAPLLDGVWVWEASCYYLSSSIKPDNSLLNGLDVIPQSVANRWWYRTEHSTTYPSIIDAQEGLVFAADSILSPGASKKGKYFYFDVKRQDYVLPQPNPEINDVREVYNTSSFPTKPSQSFYASVVYPFNTSSSPVGSISRIIDFYTYRYHTKCVSVLFSGKDLHLFENSEAALFRHDIEFNRYWHAEIKEGDGGQYYEQEAGLDFYNAFEVTAQIKVKATFPVDLISGTTTLISLPGIYQSESIFSGGGDWEEGQFDSRINHNATGTIGSTQRVTRTLRIQPIIKPFYVIEQGGEVVFPTEDQFLQLIEPQPGLFLCDPNPDPLQNRNTDPQPNNPNNTEWIGDIMPDSLRVKEIHAALQADKYANDDFSPQLARVANLGWLIDKMSNILGLHFASDGEMLKVRDTEHKKDGDTIPEQWQLGQWGKNNWIAKKSTGQNVTVNGVGYAYEVRSNGFGTDKFTGENTSIEEGGWVLCNSLLQLLESKFDDDDRAFGLQNAGANVIPRSDRTGYLSYEGMHGLLVEIAYLLSSMSGNITRSEVLNLKAVAILQELLASQGLPVTLKTIPAKIAGQDMFIPYPGVEESAPSLTDYMFWILSNLGPLVAGQLVYNEEIQEQAE